MRPIFWQLQNVWLFYLLSAAAVGIFAFGLYTRLSIWNRGVVRRATPFSWRGLVHILVDGLLGRRILRGDFAAGVMHAAILWGFLALFLGTVLLSIDHYLVTFLRGWSYLLFSTCLELAGLLLLFGLAWALWRRYVRRLPRLERRRGDFLALAWLLAIVTTGFLVESLRLAQQRPECDSWSFAGAWASSLWPESQGPGLYVCAWWVHAVLSLGFVASIPYTKLFHLLAAPVSVYLKDRPLELAPAESDDDHRETFSFRDLVSFDACTRCGRCVEVCPSTKAGEPFSPRDFLLATRERLSREYSPLRLAGLRKNRKKKVEFYRNIWHCTTCGACLEVCPVTIAAAEPLRQQRKRKVEEGTEVPPRLTRTLELLYKYRNPWEASKKNRGKWPGELEVPVLDRREKASSLCYFVGCTTSLDTRAQEIARSFASILGHAGVPYTTLGNNEPCCGDLARRVGEDGLFEEQLEECLELFDRHGLREVVTSSPHCFHTLKNERPVVEKSASIQVLHYTELLGRLAREGSLRFSRDLQVKITYHDPCYLGRHNGVYEAPRAVLDSIPGVERVEMPHHGPDSLCCGGGGGRMWQDDLETHEKMSEIRIREAESVGARTLVTACPLCLIMLEDARKTAGLEDVLQVVDLSELVASALGP